MNSTEEDALAAGRTSTPPTVPLPVATLPPKQRELTQTQRIINLEGAAQQNAAAILAERQCRQDAMRTGHEVLRRDFGDALIADRATAQDVFNDVATTVDDLDSRIAFLERRFTARRSRIRAHWWRRVLCWLLEGSESLEPGNAELRCATRAGQPYGPVAAQPLVLVAPGEAPPEAPVAPLPGAGAPTPLGDAPVAYGAPRLLPGLFLVLGLGLLGCRGEPLGLQSTLQHNDTTATAPLVSIRLQCPGVTYWTVAQDGAPWAGTYILGLFPGDSLGWTLAPDGTPLPRGVHAYTLTQLSEALPPFGTGVPRGIVLRIVTDPYGRGAGTLRCAP